MLWSEPTGVISQQTALSLHVLPDVLSAQVHLVDGTVADLLDNPLDVAGAVTAHREEGNVCRSTQPRRNFADFAATISDVGALKHRLGGTSTTIGASQQSRLVRRHTKEKPRDAMNNSPLQKYCSLLRRTNSSNAFFATGIYLSTVALIYKGTKEIVAVCFALTEAVEFTDGYEPRPQHALRYLWPRNSTHFNMGARIGRWMHLQPENPHRVSRVDANDIFYPIGGGIIIKNDNCIEVQYLSRSMNFPTKFVPNSEQFMFCQAMADISGMYVNHNGTQLTPKPWRFDLIADMNIWRGTKLGTVGLAAHCEWRDRLEFMFRHTVLARECADAALRGDWKRKKRPSETADGKSAKRARH